VKRKALLKEEESRESKRKEIRKRRHVAQGTHEAATRRRMRLGSSD